jgi:hypothetical protein
MRAHAADHNPMRHAFRHAIRALKADIADIESAMDEILAELTHRPT